ncbi:MAG: hypothetical protein ALAOOOJD_03089 [bacterium]|nr:hypothetical protein [bacterium]
MGYTRRGETYRLMKNYDAALRDFNRAIELDEKYKWAYTQCGEIYRLMGNCEKAIANFSSALAIDPENDWSWYLLGITQKKCGMLIDFTKNLEKAIKLGKIDYEKTGGSFREAFNLAIYYLVAEQNQTAYLLYEKTIAAGATKESLKDAKDDLDELTSLFPEEKEFEKALALVKKALSSIQSNS